MRPTEKSDAYPARRGSPPAGNAPPRPTRRRPRQELRLPLELAAEDAANNECQSNGIEVLRELGQLEDVTLRSITTPDLRYLAPLNHLWSLDIKLGGIRSFEGIEGKATIKYLELWQIRELEDAAVLQSLPGLQNVFLQSLPRIQALPRLDACRALRRVVLQNLKGLGDFAALEEVPAREEFALVEGDRQQPEQLVPVLRNPAIRRVKALFGSDRKNETFARLRDTHGKSDWDPWTPFEYRWTSRHHR